MKNSNDSKQLHVDRVSNLSKVVNEQNGIALSENFVNETDYKMVRNFLEVSEATEYYNTMKQMSKQYIPQFYSSSQ